MHCTLDGHTWLLAADEPLPRCDLTADLDAGEVRASDTHLPLPRQKLQLLDALVQAGAGGVTIEQLYLKLWGAREYHPLRHRNTVYVALARLRESLAKLTHSEALVELSDGRYRLGPDLHVALLRSNTLTPLAFSPGQTK